MIEASARIGVGRQQARCEAGQRPGKVLPEVVVGRALQRQAVVDLADRRALPAGLVSKVQCPARTVRHPVVGQHVGLHAAQIARLEIAELGIERRAAPRHDGRGQGRVAVRCDVPVVGYAEFEAALVVELDARWQPAGLALLGQREAERRRGQDRHAIEAQHRALGRALLGRRVEQHAVGAQQPGRIGRRTAGVGGAVGDAPVLVEEVEAVGLPSCVGAPEVVARRLEVALETVDLQLHLGAAVDVAVARDLDVAGGARQVALLLVLDPVGLQDQGATTELDGTFGQGFQVGPARQTISLDHQRPAAVVGLDEWAEARTAFGTHLQSGTFGPRLRACDFDQHAAACGRHQDRGRDRAHGPGTPWRQDGCGAVGDRQGRGRQEKRAAGHGALRPLEQRHGDATLHAVCRI